tara:strand:- start:1502 stop:2272 length:771 start_codon:yes stop_codon:yes gene_type:complete
MTFKIFEKKVYFSYRKIQNQIPKSDNLYYSKDYIYRNKKKNTKFILNKDYDFDYTFLHFILGIASIKKNITILDYGSGVGNTLIKFFKKGFLLKNIKYYLFDQNNELTKIAAKMVKKNFSNRSAVDFYYDFKKINYHEIIHFGSTLEYVEDYKRLLNQIFLQMKKKPKYLLISDFFGTKQKNFYLIGNYYGKRYFIKFHNIKKFIKFLENKGYKLIYKNPFLPNIHGKFNFFDMSNLDKKYRIDHTWNLFFEHESK